MSTSPAARRSLKVSPMRQPAGALFGPDGLTILGGDDESGGGGGIGVNSFLWRASLDTISFMPLASADPFGGVIITDWFSPPETPTERFKMTVYILDKRLRADGVRVALFKQQRTDNREWADVRPAADTSVTLENAILTRARQLRINSTFTGRITATSIAASRNVLPSTRYS